MTNRQQKKLDTRAKQRNEVRGVLRAQLYHCFLPTEGEKDLISDGKNLVVVMLLYSRRLRDCVWHLCSGLACTKDEQAE